MRHVMDIVDLSVEEVQQLVDTAMDIVENPDTIVYVSVLENEKIRKFEKKLKNKYKEKEIEKELLYMNITDDIKDKNSVNDMISKYSINGVEITDVPSILVFKITSLTNPFKSSAEQFESSLTLVWKTSLITFCFASKSASAIFFAADSSDSNI